MTYYGHQDIEWKRVGGAVTYSKDFEESVLPFISLPYGYSISSFPFIANENHIQVLHEYNERTLNMALSNPKACYITHYLPMQHELESRGVFARFIPMGVNVEGKTTKEKDWIYLGNLRGKAHSGKSELVKELSKYIKFDIISDGLYKGRPIDNPHKIVSQYKYGIGVGRSALEMWALGLKVLVCGQRFGGLVMNESDFKAQQAINCNGRVTTYCDEIEPCIKNIERSYIPEVPKMDWTLYQKVIMEYLQ